MTDEEFWLVKNLAVNAFADVLEAIEEHRFTDLDDLLTRSAAADDQWIAAIAERAGV